MNLIPWLPTTLSALWVIVAPRKARTNHPPASRRSCLAADPDAPGRPRDTLPRMARFDIAGAR